MKTRHSSFLHESRRRQQVCAEEIQITKGNIDMARSLPPIDDENAFRAWLWKYHSHKEPLVRDSIACCRRINRDLGNLKTAYDADECAGMISQLEYSIEDEHNRRLAPGNLIFKGDANSDRYYKTIKDGLATLKKQLVVYCEFQSAYRAMPVTANSAPMDGYKGSSAKSSGRSISTVHSAGAGWSVK